jgi:hypothetical protein
MPKKQLPVSSAPINEDMYKHINRIKSCEATGDEVGEIIGESIKVLLLSAMEEMAKQHPKPLQSIQYKKS